MRNYNALGDGNADDAGATCTKDAGMIIGLPESYVSGIVLENVTVKSKTGLILRDVNGIVLKHADIEAEAGPKLILENAAPVQE